MLVGGQLPGQSLIEYEGTLNIKEKADYTFELNTSGGGGLLLIDGEEVIGIDGEEENIGLTAGNTPFKLFYARHAQWGSPGFNLSVSSDGLRPHQLSDNSVTGESGINPIFVEAKDEPVLRSFRDLPEGDRITHAISVSSPDNIHYTYDLKKGNLVQLWRGRFWMFTPHVA
ncbi:MAG: PA14 domain-containing protein [Balneolaceae bacterium]|nr:PA14 domain-containing protein [Balneolaceae bacterium]